MREILFRGKRADNGEWVYGYYSNLGSYSCITKEKVTTGEMGSIIECENIKVLPETVEQYTGLTDKNGKKIFDGDIVKFIHKGKWEKDENSIFGIALGKSYSRNYKIEYINTWATYGLRFINGSVHFPCKQSTLLMYDCEIIGNIHDNPELLERGENISK